MESLSGKINQTPDRDGYPERKQKIFNSPNIAYLELTTICSSLRTICGQLQVPDPGRQHQRLDVSAVF